MQALEFARFLAVAAWDPKYSPMSFSSDLALEDLEQGVAIHLAKKLLEVLQARGKAKATAKRGLLPRAVVKEVFESQLFPPERINVHYDLLRTFDEEEYQRIHFIRVACQQAGLLRKHAGAFKITKKGEKMLVPERTVDLYLELLRAGFSKVNLAAFDGVPELPSLQYSLPVALLRLWDEGKTWVPLEDAPATYLLPEPYTELVNFEDCPRSAAHILWLRLLR